VNSRHETAFDDELVMHNLRSRSEASRGT